MSIFSTNNFFSSGDPDVAGESSFSFMSNVLDSAAGATQSFVPPSQVCAHLNAVHAYASDPTRQVETHHYCTHINEDMRQCLLYDSEEKNARLLGVEYMVSERLFRTLPPEEKQYWHSHVYEIKSGMLVMPKPPGMPASAWDTAETKAMEELVSWYGKVYHLWQVDRGDRLPLGPPQLMMSVTRDENLDQNILAKRNERMGIDQEHKRKLREHIQAIDIDRLADKGTGAL